MANYPVDSSFPRSNLTRLDGRHAETWMHKEHVRLDHPEASRQHACDAYQLIG